MIQAFNLGPIQHSIAIATLDQAILPQFGDTGNILLSDTLFTTAASLVPRSEEFQPVTRLYFEQS
jgi:hypothetical protein